MAHDDDGLTKGLFLGFLAGSVIGAVTALLLAPKSGRELREDIKTSSRTLRKISFNKRAKKRVIC